MPFYFWGIVVPRLHRQDVGTLRLEVGASVSGWVTGLARASATLVELVPESLEPTGTPTGNRLAARKKIAVPNDRGFYQFREVARGSYSVTARAAGVSPAHQQGVLVNEAREYVLKEPLLLQPLAKVTIMLDPVVDPFEHPWNLSLERAIPLSDYASRVAQGSAGPDGVWSREGIENGAYEIAVSDSEGAVQLRQQLKIAEVSATIHLNVPVVQIRGTVSVGGTPLEARLIFRNPDGRRAGFATDEHGEFAGYLAAEGRWNVDMTPRPQGATRTIQGVEVNRSPGEPWARVDISLEGGRLKGDVVDEDGNRTRANVLVRRNGKVEAQMMTGDDGLFEVLGLAPGEIKVEARGAAGLSGLIPATISRDNTTTVRLVARRKSRLVGRVLSQNGTPISGALLRFSETGSGEYHEETSGIGGAFSFRVRPEATSLDLVVLAPAFPIKITRLDLTAEVSDPVALVLADAGGALLVHGGKGGPLRVAVKAGPVTMPIVFLFFPSGPAFPREISMETKSATLQLEPGGYGICDIDTGRCEDAQVRAGEQILVELR